MALTRNRQKSVQRKIAHLRRRPVNTGESAVQETDHAFGRQPQHNSNSAPKTSKRYSASEAISSGNTTMTAAPTTGAEGVAGAADDDGQQKQDRLRERETIGRDEHSSGANMPPATPVNTAERAKASGLDADRIEADRRGAAISESRTAIIALPQALRARRWKGIERQAGQQTWRSRESRARPTRPPPSAGLRHAHQAVLAAGQLAPLDGAVLRR